MTTTTSRSLADERGLSILETVFATSLILVVALGVLPLGVLAVNTTENQGHLMARTAEYAQDKMEQLLALAFDNATADTGQVITQSSGGSGLTPGGGIDVDHPVNLYVDYLDVDGKVVTGAEAARNWYYKRVWQVTSVSTTLKRVTVVATTRNSLGGIGRIPRATMTSLKTFPF